MYICFVVASKFYFSHPDFVPDQTSVIHIEPLRGSDIKGAGRVILSFTFNPFRVVECGQSNISFRFSIQVPKD
jgi:hypothetical protein